MMIYKRIANNAVNDKRYANKLIATQGCCHENQCGYKKVRM